MVTIPAQYIIDEQGAKTAVVLSIEVYQKLLADLHDLRVIADRRHETPVSLAEMKQRLHIANEQL